MNEREANNNKRLSAYQFCVSNLIANIARRFDAEMMQMHHQSTPSMQRFDGR